MVNLVEGDTITPLNQLNQWRAPWGLLQIRNTPPRSSFEIFFLRKRNGLTRLNHHRQPVRAAGDGFDADAPQGWSAEFATRGEAATEEGLKEGLAGAQLRVC